MDTVDLETAIKQEEDYLRKVHPTVDDIPGCMTLFDEFLKCHGMRQTHFRIPRPH